MDWKLEIRWENNIFKNVKDSSHRPAMIGYNKWRRMISAILCTQDTVTSAKVHTSTSQIYLIQCHPLYSQLQPLTPIFYSLNTPCSLPLQSLFGLLVSSSYLFHPWLFACQPFTTFHVSTQHFTSQRGHPSPFSANSPLEPYYSLSKTASLFL